MKIDVGPSAPPMIDIAEACWRVKSTKPACANATAPTKVPNIPN